MQLPESAWRGAQKTTLATPQQDSAHKIAQNPGWLTWNLLSVCRNARLAYFEIIKFHAACRSVLRHFSVYPQQWLVLKNVLKIGTPRTDYVCNTVKKQKIMKKKKKMKITIIMKAFHLMTITIIMTKILITKIKIKSYSYLLMTLLTRAWSAVLLVTSLTLKRSTVWLYAEKASLATLPFPTAV